MDSRPEGPDPVAQRSDTSSTNFEERDTSPSATIIDAVARAAGQDPVELEPLFATVDPEALDSLLDDGRADLDVEFTYEGFRVRASSDGRVEVRETGVPR